MTSTYLDARQTAQLAGLLAERPGASVLIEHVPGANFRVTFARFVGERDERVVERDAHIITGSGTTYPTDAT